MTDNNKYCEIYNEAYKRFTPGYVIDKNLDQIDRFISTNNRTLSKFVKDYFEEFASMESLSQKSILETGCGLGGLSFYLSDFATDITAIDISQLAISAAKELNNLKKKDINFVTGDILSHKLNNKFDIILDSHLYHCLADKKSRMSYLDFVKSHLKPGGIFMAECMTYHDEIQEPLEYDLNEDYVLKQKLNDEWVAVRSILPAIEIENEVKSSGLDISYFYYHHELSFDVFKEYPDYPVFRLPKTVRLCAKLK